ncbi:hypothetical protein H9L39_08004 [Fusarium oxysporum f. sp. albedinis]|nr:hypothetical protein H9L39_19754 [Fusarium oxysporum f. sp. albedinis]KAK2480436.1 hypothetical protein H9L39_08004 [Fusarium oxysporum f. sp. albedinis]
MPASHLFAQSTQPAPADGHNPIGMINIMPFFIGQDKESLSKWVEECWIIDYWDHGEWSFSKVRTEELLLAE